MENAGCVTFLEDYVFRSRVTDTRREEQSRHDPARDGAHVVRRPGHHAVVGRPVAERVVRVLGSRGRADRGDPLDRRLDRRSRRVWKAWAYRQDQLPSTHPIAADIPDIEAVEVNFDGITYAKGAAVLKQLVAYVGRDNFLAGVRAYFAEHAWATPRWPTCSARWSSTPAATSRPWSKSWLETAGVNTLRPSFELDADGRFSSFAVLQEAPAQHPELRPHRIAIGLYDRDRGEDQRILADGPGRARHRRRRHRRARARRRAAARTWSWSTTTT